MQTLSETGSTFGGLGSTHPPETYECPPPPPRLGYCIETSLSFFSHNSNASDDGRLVAKREGQALAASLDATYAECSSLLSDGVQQALDTAVQLTFTNSHRRTGTKGFFRRKKNQTNSAKDDEPLPPVMPPAGTIY